MFNQSWETKINRADQLAAASEATRELLLFYSALLRAQKKIYDALSSRKDWLPSGTLQEDVSVIGAFLPDLLKTIETIGSPSLIEEAHALLQCTEVELHQRLFNEWRAPSGNHFFAKAFLQPYARRLTELHVRPKNRALEFGENRCPNCAGKPQVSCLVSKDSSADGGGRELICSTCLAVWSFRRVVCASCKEERPSKLGYFQASQYDYVRIEACDSCGYYIKGVDLTRFGFAVPLVDEVAAAPLDLWAQAQGYQKIELNLVGL